MLSIHCEQVQTIEYGTVHSDKSGFAVCFSIIHTLNQYAKRQFRTKTSGSNGASDSLWMRPSWVMVTSHIYAKFSITLKISPKLLSYYVHPRSRQKAISAGAQSSSFHSALMRCMKIYV